MAGPQQNTRYPQLAKEPLLTSKLRGNPENRVAAKLIDFFIIEGVIWVLSFLWPMATWVLPIFYWSFVDKFGNGQSPGKWLLGLHTIEGQRGYRPGAYQGFIRNFPFLLLSLGLGLGGMGAWVLLVPAVVMLLLETYFIFNVRSGLRVGDILGNTRVADYKDEHTQFIEQFLKEEDAV